MSLPFIISIAVFGSLWWLAIYLVSRNPRSKIAWISAAFLVSLSTYGLITEVSRNLTDYYYYDLVWKLTNWSYLLPIPLIFHFSAVVTGRQKNTLNKTSLFLLYLVVSILFILCTTTDLVVSTEINGFVKGIGYLNPRGPLFWLVIVLVGLASLGATYNYIVALKNQEKLGPETKIKFRLATLSSFLYLIIGPLSAYLFYDPNQQLAIQLTPLLFIIAFLPMIIAILFYRLISDVDYIFNWKEFTYLTLTVAVINTINGAAFMLFVVPYLGEISYILVCFFMLITITTHGFYDWLATFVRDLVYNAGKGFSLITDSDVNDLVRNFHNPEKLETNAVVKFKIVKRQNKSTRLVDSAQNTVRGAIDYFKQPDYPRRTKQNLKYQLLKMLTLDESEEGQILWELGFEGYPMKIMNGENHTRNPLFKIEAMSDYTATSRNAFIALKKEALHDLGWRLSYLERSEK